MKDQLDNIDAELLLILQKGVPLEERPFDIIGRKLGLSEKAVMDKAVSFIRNGLVRRFGAVFEAKRLGYSSTLCAVDIPDPELDRSAAAICAHPGITHCYGRDGHPNLWLTMTAPAEEMTAELSKVAKLLEPYELFSFPAKRTFKIGVVLDARNRQNGNELIQESIRTSELTLSSGKFDATDRAIISILQGNIGLSSPDPLEPAARAVGMSYRDLLAKLAQWKDEKTLRRFGFIPYHRELGYAINAMCAWKADESIVENAGKSLAQSAHVTHCYERIANRAFPFNLFAMLHAVTLDEAMEIRRQLGSQAGLSGGKMLLSVKEFKKTSPVYFG